MGYKNRKSFFMKGIQTTKIIPTLRFTDSDDIMTQNLGTPGKNTTGAQ